MSNLLQKTGADYSTLLKASVAITAAVAITTIFPEVADAMTHSDTDKAARTAQSAIVKVNNGGLVAVYNNASTFVKDYLSWIMGVLVSGKTMWKGAFNNDITAFINGATIAALIGISPSVIEGMMGAIF